MKSIKWRLVIVLFCGSFLLLIRRSQNINFVINFAGVIQISGLFTLPINWVFLMMAPILIVGDSTRRLVRHDYLMVTSIPINEYLRQIFTLAISMPIVWWLLNLVFGGGRIDPAFALAVLIVLIWLTIIDCVIQIFIDPIITLLICLGILIAASAINTLPILSSAMALRYDQQSWWGLLVGLFLTVIGVKLVLRQLYRIDFLG
ncbi:MAG: hypothetical protein LKE89_00560 [Lactobacillaceae bacterium]|nr:hypothetical protein [Lactobacillaceae bacterium]